MIFNSLEFVLFFTSFFALYWTLGKDARFQNIIILCGNYFFYAYASWKLSFLLLAYSLINFYLGALIYKSKNERTQQWLLRSGVLLGTGLLLYFKYLNFFITNISNLLSLIHLHTSIHTLEILLPLGISFYIFRTLSYILDIYYGKMKPTANVVNFLSFVSFFPTLMAGPIDRAKFFLPQLEKKRLFDYDFAADGIRQILWGLFKKLVIADACAPIVDQIFGSYNIQLGSTLLLGGILYVFQLYADFSGYSDMAIGVGKLMGFNVTRNFAFPLFSLNISDYWRKWHISLTSWLTDYVFTPLSVMWRKLGKRGNIMAVMITFLLIGAWHEANWTWILFGALNGLLFIPLILENKMLKGGGIVAKGKLLPSFKELIQMLTTFTIIIFLFIISRSVSIFDAVKYILFIFSRSLFSKPSFVHGILMTLILLMLIIEWLNRDKQFGLQISGIKQPVVRWLIYYSVIILILLFQATPVKFIYLQF